MGLDRRRRVREAIAVAAALAVAWAGAPADAGDVESRIAAGDLDGAVEAGRAAVAADPDDPDAHMALAQALATKGRRVQPVVDATLDVDDLTSGDVELPVPTPENARLEVVYDRELLDEALAEVRKAIRLAPDRQDLRFSECFLLTDAGEIQKAAQAIFRLTESLPQSPALAGTLSQYGSERAKRGDYAGAVVLLGAVASAYPDAPRVQVELASALARTGDRDAALAALDRAAKLATGDVETSRRLAFLGLLLQDFPRAEASFRRAYEIGGDPADLLGAAVSAFGTEPSSASVDLERLALAEPEAAYLAETLLRAVEDDSHLRMEAVTSLLADGQNLLAIPVVHRVLAGNPGHGGADAAMNEIYRKMGFPRP